ncbi:pupal cuticle protein Edg-91 isoform X1 [Drosophila novamexicana]|uniref:pupal cuticle protein Edg-91 isoform X1 n=1 Tax=Drosophila novamexicana TaxID=47314 RepID=UPI0011E5B0CC|nr:pupal cuticle protein Edg-91 isoform X1 [Drosophila novamexicana]XP_032291448.1 pupal cuticle protein Edg-91 isoform X1 [Drosophila virilis]
MFNLRSVYLLLACALFCLLLSCSEAAPRPQEEQSAAGDLEAGVEAEEKDLQGAASYGYGYYASPYLGSYYGGGGYWPHYSGSYYGLGEFGYPYYGGYYGLHHHHHGHYGHYF